MDRALSFYVERLSSTPFEVIIRVLYIRGSSPSLPSFEAYAELIGVLAEDASEWLEAEAYYCTAFDLLVRFFPAVDDYLALFRETRLYTKVHHPFALVVLDRWVNFLLKQQRISQASGLSMQFSMLLIRFPVPGALLKLFLFPALMICRSH